MPGTADQVYIGEHHVTHTGNRYMTISVILATRFVMVFLHTEKNNYPALLQQAIVQAGEKEAYVKAS
jgi:hypothetical protein